MSRKTLKGFEEFTLDQLKAMAAPDEEVVDDEDNPLWTAEAFAEAMTVDELPPDLHDAVLAAFPKTKLRGPQKAPTKVAVSLRLSRDVVDHYRATGEGWQTRIDEALREAIRRAG